MTSNRPGSNPDAPAGPKPAPPANPPEVKTPCEKCGLPWFGVDMAGPSQLDRIEAKLDQLIEALADEGEEESEFIDVTSMDGSTTKVPRQASEFLNRRGEGHKSGRSPS